MNIGILLPSIGVYGGVRRFVGLANELSLRKHDVTIYTPDGKSCVWLKCISKWNKYDNFLSMKNDAIIFGYPGQEDRRLSSMSNAKKKIFWCCGIYDPKDIIGLEENKNPWIKKINNITLKYLHDQELIKIAVSSWLTNFCKEYLKINKINTIFCGIDRDIFKPFEGIKKIKDSILSPCEKRSFKSKHLMKVIFAKVKKRVPSATLSSYRGMGIRQSKMSKFISSHEIYSDDTILAGWHNPAIEAMACGLPVACFDFGGIRDFAIHGKTALLAAKGKPISLAKATITLLLDKNMAIELSKNAMDHISQFTWKRCGNEFEEILNG